MENERNPETANPAGVTPVEPSVVVDPITPSAGQPAEVVPVPSVGEAPLGARIGAFLIDVLITIAAVMIIGRISGILGNAVGIAYMLTRDSLPFLDGQSLGKKALKIKAVTEDGESLSGNWAPGLLRNAVLFIPLFPLVELIVLIIGKDKPGGLRRLGDQWAKTKVVAAP